MNLRKKVNIYALMMPEISKRINYYDINKGRLISPYFVTLQDATEIKTHYQTFLEYNFSVRAQTHYGYYNCIIGIKDNKIIKTMCECEQFNLTSSCKHLGACFYHYSDEMFKAESESLIDISKKVIDRYYTKKAQIKKELKLEINILINHHKDNYYGDYNEVIVKALIGNTKMYNLTSHFNRFYECLTSEEGNYKFGKELDYNYKDYYLTDANLKIIKALHKYYEVPSYNRDDNKLIDLLESLDNFSFTINNHQIDHIEESFPIESNIKKVDDKYIVDFDLNEILAITDDYTYIYYKGNVYHLKTQEKSLIEDLIDNQLQSLEVNKDDLNTFSNGLLKIIKAKAIVDETAKDDIIISAKPEPEIYFDISSNIIKAKLILNYNGIETEYFKQSAGIIRDDEYENEIVADILSYGFSLNKNKLELTELNEQVSFLEYGLNELAQKYKVFTSEKLKKVNLKNQTSVYSMFSIGQDNIMNYDFSLDGINQNEIVNIFKDIRAKKKYYRLKNGDILNLEDDHLKELEDITSKMEITDEDIINGKGEIQKYRAIYLDSLKSSRYKYLKTDNLFTEFIENFYKYKNASLTIDEAELKTLRDYQLTGVKWLYNISKTGFGGILADEMGLGKTIQTIYYIKQILLDDQNSKFLIVVPTALVYNWKHEFEMFGSKIKVSIVSGQKVLREKLLETEANVYITSYGMLREDAEIYNEKTFHTMIIDEAQNIKNHMAGITQTVKGIKATTKFALTGTPIENSPLELWSIFDFVMPGFLSDLMRFKAKYKIKDFDDETNKLLSSLSSQITPFILRRKKQDVIKELPPKIENNIYVELTDEQKKLYVAELEDIKKKMNDIMASDGINKVRFLILQLLTKLRQLCIDPRIIYENYNGGSNKIDSLILTLKENMANGNKVLVFTSFRTALNLVASELVKEHIPFYVIEGSVSGLERNKRVDEFNARNTPAVFLITLKSGGVGLNLASASTVIHLDLWWNPQAENQATDRAHRIGQKNVVEIIHLICKGTIEEKILEMQKKKIELSNKIIDGEVKDKNVISELTEKDIKELLAYENSDL